MKIGVLIQTKPDRFGAVVIPKMETLNLDTLAQPNDSGRWTSSSPYLGNKVSGRYEAWDADAANYPPLRLRDPFPVGLFFDDLSTPFLVLDNFRPTNLAKKGFGRLLRVNKYVDTMEIEWQPLAG